MLIGHYNHIIDNKKRLSIPSKWRNYFGEKVIVTTGLDKSLFVFGEKEWENIASDISKNGFLNIDERNFSRFILSNAYELSFDSHGRVLLPEALTQFAGLTSEVVLSGVYDRCEIWDKVAFDKMMNSINAASADIALRLAKNVKE